MGLPWGARLDLFKGFKSLAWNLGPGVGGRELGRIKFLKFFKFFKFFKFPSFLKGSIEKR